MLIKNRNISIDNNLVHRVLSKHQIAIQDYKREQLDYDYRLFITMTYKNKMYDRVTIENNNRKIKRMIDYCFYKRYASPIKYAFFNEKHLDKSLHTHFLMTTPTNILRKDKQYLNAETDFTKYIQYIYATIRKIKSIGKTDIQEVYDLRELFSSEDAYLTKSLRNTYRSKSLDFDCIDFINTDFKSDYESYGSLARKN